MRGCPFLKRCLSVNTTEHRTPLCRSETIYHDRDVKAWPAILTVSSWGTHVCPGKGQTRNDLFAAPFLNVAPCTKTSSICHSPAVLSRNVCQPRLCFCSDCCSMDSMGGRRIPIPQRPWPHAPQLLGQQKVLTWFSRHAAFVTFPDTEADSPVSVVVFEQHAALALVEVHRDTVGRLHL